MYAFQQTLNLTINLTLAAEHIFTKKTLTLTLTKNPHKKLRDFKNPYLIPDSTTIFL